MTHWPRFGCDVASCGKRITCIQYAVIWTNSSVTSLTHTVDLLSLTTLTKPRKYTDRPLWETSRKLQSRFPADQLLQRQLPDPRTSTFGEKQHPKSPISTETTDQNLFRKRALPFHESIVNAFVTWYEELQFSNALLWDSEIKLQRFQTIAQILFTPTSIADKLNGLEDYDSH